MNGKNTRKFASWGGIITVAVALFTITKFVTNLYQEYVIEPRQKEEANNSLMNQAYQIQQDRYDDLDKSLKKLNQDISGEDNAEDGYYIESIALDGYDIVLTSVLTNPMNKRELIEIKMNLDKVKKEAFDASIPDYCNKDSFFRQYIVDDFNVRMVTKDSNKKQILSYIINKNDCKIFESKTNGIEFKK